MRNSRAHGVVVPAEDSAFVLLGCLCVCLFACSHFLLLVYLFARASLLASMSPCLYACLSFCLPAFLFFCLDVLMNWASIYCQSTPPFKKLQRSKEDPKLTIGQQWLCQSACPSLATPLRFPCVPLLNCSINEQLTHPQKYFNVIHIHIVYIFKRFTVARIVNLQPSLNLLSILHARDT